MTDEALFDIYFRGELYSGFDADTAREEMARLFNSDADSLAPFFSGEPQPVKLRVSEATVDKFRTALEAIGLRLVVVPSGGELPEPEPEAAATPETVPATADEPQARPQLDTSALSLADAGADLLDEHPEVTPPVLDLSALSVAEKGVDLLDEPRPEPPPAPNTDHLSLD